MFEATANLRGWRTVYVLKQDVRVGATKVPAGFETDFASMPRITARFLPPTGKYMWAAARHDYLYAQHKVRRLKVDRLFLRDMRKAGVNAVVATVMYLAVRIVGYRYWKGA